MGNCQKDEGGERVIIGDGKGPVSQIRITNYVWNKDYQGLFDYDSKSIEKKTFMVNGNAIISKIGTKFELLDDNLKSLNENKIKNALFRVAQKQNFYQINPIFLQSQNYTLQKLLWLAVSSLPNKRHIIQERDILKLGKQKLRVRQIVHVDQNPSIAMENMKLSKVVYQDLSFKIPESKTQLKTEKQVKENHSEITTSDQVCRICLDAGQYDNPLITPCKCSGSVKYIHLNCLKAWLAKRLSTNKSQYCITINWLPLSCEMCKAAFKYRIYMDGKKFYTVDIPKPSKPYMIVELMRKSNSTKGKIFHFITFAEKPKIALGRRKDIDVRISEDISISRAHAVIEYIASQRQFRLSDNKSKFGTLILVKKGLIIRPMCAGISFQVGAQVYSFEAVRGGSISNFIADNGDQNQYLLDYLSDEQDQDIEQDNDDQQSDQDNPGDDEEQGSPHPRMRQRNTQPPDQN